MDKEKKNPAGETPAGNKEKLCRPETCGDCEYYKYYSLCGPGCHLTFETGIIRTGPITKDCPYKVKISKKEQKERAKRHKTLAKKEKGASRPKA